MSMSSEPSQTRSATPPQINRLTSTRLGGKLVKDYWDRLFTAKERGAQVVWYNGAAVSPLFQAAGIEWCHGEAFGARLAAMHLEGPAQRTGEDYGYINELCSYARTTLGCAVLTKRATVDDRGISLPEADQEALASRLPPPDFFVNAYAGCSTGQQWDEISYRLFDKKLPFFKISYPLLWGNKPDAGYLRGEEWESASRQVARQVYKLIEFLEHQTGRPFDWEALRESMHYIKRASQLRLEAMALCRSKPAPATFWDWIASIAPINFLPGNQDLVDYFAGVKAEIEQRLSEGVVALPNERYRLAFDGIMNWNKVGWLANKFAENNAAVLTGRYTHNSFWNEPQLIDEDDPILGMAQHYLLCPFNHSAKVLGELLLRECENYGIEGVVFHATRTCRSASNGQLIIAQMAQRAGLQTMFFEGDVADASFYKDAILESRLEAMLEAIDTRRMSAT
ncbi:2-hydroxyacyl-CoA dehydratase subunit D [Azospirillum agricola]|uniref:2-hydroxyacyl-CoA dehydratase subunit D n=1 Tax=Azospirillum agricola TaxID=1720247 RepID=UPI000A0EF548|nr:2-hydroxyacyl-CoA dehydratase family protein [Azospirillum agricola]SMH38601.1 2-hydroxyglutaryl-CoA dehydratase, D-component [Azospirillum lipoferum]